jgi:predicted  nucleic acid-binding Zn-ribbon protein
MQSLDEELVDSNKKIKKLEENIAILQDILVQQQTAITETQRYLIKVAHGQKEITKRMLSWPYVKVQTRKTKDF